MSKGSTIVRTSKPERKEWKQSYSCFTEEMFECSSGRLRFNKDGTIELVYPSSINPKK